ncbi:glycosyltransferase family 4 protein [Algoriphagus antarcticus]|uniref:Glycosyltransferase involved in cell wall biosynthesis n=1 Tax=Algoriphagus antarcticus TaxID=238540 RepID=A0A3E0E1B6_9BACT|nr:glycosyltransferase family 4 protein [Algoriphagus antarcticus]REG92001.1 glycosyltransferase involved in cell wall biosynthesis [Algoriphagus antarcticus]
MGSPIKIIFNPCENKENKYIAILVNGLEKHGFEVNRLDDFLSSTSHYKSIRLLHLNWFENLDDSSVKSMWTSYFRKLIVLAAIKLGNKKLVWTMHNRLSHEKKSGKLSRALTKKLVAQADAIVIHSAISKNILRSQFPNLKSKIVHIPHPDFIDVYGQMIPERSEKRPSKLKLLFIGAIKPYKNIELLIQIAGRFSEEIHLTIAGNPNSEAYRTELEKLAQGANNITLELKFIPDSELPTYIHQSDVLILPYSQESSLNSGTVILGFSYGRTVICPRIGTIDDLDGGEDVFDYSYENESEHLAALEKQIQSAINLHLEDSNSLTEKGHRMRDLVLEKNNKQVVTDKLIELYQSFLD